MATVHSLMVTLPQMVDMALGSPEIGAVNFNILNAILHVVIQQTQLSDHVVEYRGPNKDQINNYLQNATPTGSIKVTELNQADKDKRVKLTEGGSEDRPSYQKRLLVEHLGAKKSKYEPQIMVGLSQNKLKQIEENVEELRDKMEEIMGLPNNETIMEAIRNSGNDSTKPVYDMWQALKVATRVDAMEVALSKLTSITEDLIQDAVNVNLDIKPPKSINSSRKSLTCSSKISTDGRLKAGGDETPKDVSARSPSGSVEPKRRTSSFFKNFVSEIAIRIDSLEERIVSLEDKGETDAGDIDTSAILKEMVQIKKQLKTFAEDIGNITKGGEGKSLGDVMKELVELKATSKSATQEGSELDEKFTTYNDKLNNLDEALSSQINKLQTLYIELENELNIAREMITAKDEIVDEMSLSEMYNKMVKVQEDMEVLNQVSNNLKEELSEKQHTLDILVEQIQVLKTAKADREDLEDALADKADAQQVNRKVSVNQFDATCDDITRNIENAMQKLQQQEEAWRGTLEELQNRLGLKLDKGEFDPLKDFVNKKIKSLQDRVKELIAMRQQQEAAGTKHKLLKDVNCISCDKNVVMQRENQFVALPTTAPLPGTRSMKPYITYELDAVRKQQKALPGSRNMVHLETALHEKQIPTKEKATPREKQFPPGHLCNRYCGGSHTMTVPQQRVAHIGHFLQQWGPHAISLDDAQILGSDGQMYKSRDPPAKVKEAAKERSKLSACIQTDEDASVVPRMSEGLLKTPKGDEERKHTSVSIIKPGEADSKRAGSRSSISKKRRTSSKSAGEIRKASIDSKKEQEKAEPRKASVTLKRLSRQKDLSSIEQDSPPRGAAHLDDEVKLQDINTEETQPTEAEADPEEIPASIEEVPVEPVAEATDAPEPEAAEAPIADEAPA